MEPLSEQQRDDTDPQTPTCARCRPWGSGTSADAYVVLNAPDRGPDSGSTTGETVVNGLRLGGEWTHTATGARGRVVSIEVREGRTTVMLSPVGHPDDPREEWPFPILGDASYTERGTLISKVWRCEPVIMPKTELLAQWKATP